MFMPSSGFRYGRIASMNLASLSAVTWILVFCDGCSSVLGDPQ